MSRNSPPAGGVRNAPAGAPYLRTPPPRLPPGHIQPTGRLLLLGGGLGPPHSRAGWRTPSSAHRRPSLPHPSHRHLCRNRPINCLARAAGRRRGRAARANARICSEQHRPTHNSSYAARHPHLLNLPHLNTPPAARGTLVMSAAVWLGVPLRGREGGTEARENDGAALRAHACVAVELNLPGNNNSDAGARRAAQP